MPQNPHDDLHPAALTWAALLGRWLDFARASVALPDDEAGRRWRDAVAPVVTLQAVAFALAQLHELPEDERALGLDRAEILIRNNAKALSEIWRGEPMPDLLLDLLVDARRALAAAQLGGILELTYPTPDHASPIAQPIEVPDLTEHLTRLRDAGFPGTVRLAAPGTLLVPGEPLGHILGAAHWSPPPDRPDVLTAFLRAAAPAEAVVNSFPRQIYRRIDHAGRIEKDILAPLDAPPQPGRPLLLTGLEHGRLTPPTTNRESWLAQQRKAWPDNPLRIETLDR